MRLYFLKVNYKKITLITKYILRLPGTIFFHTMHNAVNYMMEAGQKRYDKGLR